MSSFFAEPTDPQIIFFNFKLHRLFSIFKIRLHHQEQENNCAFCDDIQQSLYVLFLDAFLIPQYFQISLGKGNTWACVRRQLIAPISLVEVLM